MYLFMDMVYASDSCSGLGATKTSLVVPVPTTAPGTTPVHFGLVDNLFTNVASFNITDILSSPNPYSIYTSQPYCASTILENHCDESRCPTTRPYNPTIVVPDNVLAALDAAWVSCSADLRRLYVPPKALQPVFVEAGPYVPTTSHLHTIPATPGPTISSNSGRQTAEAPLEDPSSSGLSTSPSRENVDGQSASFSAATQDTYWPNDNRGLAASCSTVTSWLMFSTSQTNPYNMSNLPAATVSKITDALGVLEMALSQTNALSENPSPTTISSTTHISSLKGQQTEETSDRPTPTPGRSAVTPAMTVLN